MKEEMQTIILKDEDGYLLAYIKTNANIEILQSIFDDSFNKINEENRYNYDVDQFIEDIENSGYEATRIYLDEMEFY